MLVPVAGVPAARRPTGVCLLGIRQYMQLVRRNLTATKASGGKDLLRRAVSEDLPAQLTQWPEPEFGRKSRDRREGISALKRPLVGW